jgi:hypothetical protein
VRKALNDNPVAQIGVLAALAVIVAFLLLTRMSQGGGSDPPADAAADPAATAPAAGATASGVAPAAPAAAGTAPAPVPGPATGEPVGEFAAGPGLPRPVVDAYRDGKAVVLFVFRHRGLDDSAVRRSVEGLRSRSDLAVFVTHAARISRYARIAAGVNVNRVPALIVVRPRRLTTGTPTASVSYGFRGPDSVDQAVRDALYKGPTNLPYYPK